MDSFKITNFGPINKVDIQLGDLTILLGPQASGKTLFLQMLKLLVDKDHIVQNFEAIQKPSFYTHPKQEFLLVFNFLGCIGFCQVS